MAIGYTRNAFSMECIAGGADAGGAKRTSRCEHRRLPADHTISEMNTYVNKL